MYYIRLMELGNSYGWYSITDPWNMKDDDIGLRYRKTCFNNKNKLKRSRSHISLEKEDIKTNTNFPDSNIQVTAIPITCSDNHTWIR